VALCACGGPERGRVLLIGIDGASPRVTEFLMEQGRLPNLAAIAREGVSGPLRSAAPISSPRIWNTIATGMVPERHGIVGFAREDENGSPQLLLSSDRKTPALWNIASAAGLSVGVVNFWNTYPPERIDGVMVSDHLIAKQIEGRRKISKVAIETPTGAVIHPESWHARLSRLIEASEPLTAFADPFAGNNALPRWVQWKRKELSRRFREDGALVQIALEIETALRPDLMMVLLTGVDRISHFLWGTIEPAELYPPNLRGSPSEREAGSKALYSYYDYADALIGKLAEGYGPNDLVMVVSDHGFEAGQALMLLTGVHESEKSINGVLFARGPGIPAGDSTGSVSIRDVTPTILAWLGLPVADDMDGRPAAFLRREASERIASYGHLTIERVSQAPSGVEDEIIEQLRGLGYVE
jgi:predicted AlkP superfamily phosphohydrolase/phosphomutase